MELYSVVAVVVGNFLTREILKTATLTLIVINRLQVMDSQYIRIYKINVNQVYMVSFLRSCHKWKRQLKGPVNIAKTLFIPSFVRHSPM